METVQSVTTRLVIGFEYALVAFIDGALAGTVPMLIPGLALDENTLKALLYAAVMSGLMSVVRYRQTARQHPTPQSPA